MVVAAIVVQCNISSYCLFYIAGLTNEVFSEVEDLKCRLKDTVEG